METISISILFSILSFLPMVASQSRTALQGAMLKYTYNIFNQSNVKNRINNLITIAKINFI